VIPPGVDAGGEQQAEDDEELELESLEEATS
jgi:hypothetical protein